MSCGLQSLGIWLILVSFANCLVFSLLNTQTNSKAARILGDLYIGGLIEIHDAGGKNNVNCSNMVIDPYGFQRLEAMLYAVKKVNADPSILQGMKLGVVIRDSCGSETKALDEALQFVIDKVPTCENSGNETGKEVSAVYGVIGTGMSILDAQVASLLRLFQIPQISYGATSIELDDVSKYDFFLRTVPADSFQVQAIVNFIVHSLGWDAVYGISSAGTYGERGMESFVKVAKDAGLCVVDSVRVTPHMTKNELRRLLQRLDEQDQRVTGLVVICEKPDIQLMLTILEEKKFVERFFLIGSDSWASSLFHPRSVWFSIHYNESSLSEFYDYYSRTRASVVVEENPWLNRFWKEQCGYAQSSRNTTDLHCNDYMRSTYGFCVDEFKQATCSADDKVPYVIDAVFAFAYALGAMLKAECPTPNKTDCLSRKDGKKFFEQYLKRVNFTGLSGKVNFEENVKRGKYDINTFNANGSITKVGIWDSGHLLLEHSWRNNFNGSTCKETCRPGYRRQYKEPLQCCWSCVPCRAREYLKDNYTCETCPDGYKPQPMRNFTTCYQLEIRHLSLGWLAATVFLASSGILLTFVVFSFFIRNNDTPLIKASGRELSYMLLAGIMLLYSVPFLLAVYPSALPCGVARFGIGFLLCVCYAALLIRTNRIARIFSGRQDLSFLSPRWQVVLTAFFVLPQVLIGLVGLIYDAPKGVLSYENEHYTVVKCNTESKDLIASLAYNLLLVVMCTVYAFRTRKVPNNFNEARYIGFVMYTTLVIWIAFLPVFFSASSEYQTVAIVLDLLINATTLLVGMFGMKMYILVFRPDKNSRSNSKMRSITLSYFSEGDGTVVMEDKSSCVGTPRFKGSMTPQTPLPALVKFVDKSDCYSAESLELTNGHGGMRNGLSQSSLCLS